MCMCVCVYVLLCVCVHAWVPACSCAYVYRVIYRYILTTYICILHCCLRDSSPTSRCASHFSRYKCKFGPIRFLFHFSSFILGHVDSICLPISVFIFVSMRIYFSTLFIRTVQQQQQNSATVYACNNRVGDTLS